MKEHDFKFGLETEYIVANKLTGEALWHDNLNFETLNTLLESISLEGIPSLDGLELEPPHKKLMPFVVEGYHLPDQDFQARDLLPKGIEIRTPVCNSISECLNVQKILLSRLCEAMEKQNLAPLALSHHPVACQFKGPQNKRRHDFWQWAMEVMTTYGPDFNVGLPQELWDRLDQEDLLAKINYYSPAMTAFSVASPFRAGELWEIRNTQGASLRTYRRSIIAPPIEIHPHENRRLEFKVFDMSPDIRDYEGYFLLFMTLLLDEGLKGRASNATRIYDSGEVAVTGFESEKIYQRACQILDSSYKILPKWGFGTEGLNALSERLEARQTPSAKLINNYLENGRNLLETLKHLAVCTSSMTSL